MTTPAEPDTGAGAEPDTGSAPNTDVDQQPDASATDTTDWQAEAEKYKALARKHEQRAKDNKKALDEAAAARQGDAEELPEHAQERLTAAEERALAAEERLVELSYRDAVRGAAAKAGADEEALLDSSGFRDAVAEELGEDFDDEEMAAAVAKVVKDFAKKPRFTRSTTAPPRSGGEMTGTPPPAKQRATSLHEALSRAVGGGGN